MLFVRSVHPFLLPRARSPSESGLRSLQYNGAKTPKMSVRKLLVTLGYQCPKRSVLP